MLRIRIAGLCILCSLRVRDGNTSILLLLHLTTYLVSATNPLAPLYRVNDGTLYCIISFSPPFLIATLEYIVPSIASLYGSRSKYIQVHSHSSSHSNSEHKQIMCSCVDYRNVPFLFSMEFADGYACLYVLYHQYGTLPYSLIVIYD